MGERVGAIVKLHLILVPMVVVVAVKGDRSQLYIALIAAVFAYIAALNVWLWARCRSWPEVRTVFEPSEPATDRHDLQLVYNYADATYSRPAQTRGAVGSSVSLRVNPRDPGLSSLSVSRPDRWIGVSILASCVLVGTVISSLTA